MSKSHEHALKWLDERNIQSDAENFGLIYLAYVEGFLADPDPEPGEWMQNTGGRPQVDHKMMLDIKLNDGTIYIKISSVHCVWGRMGMPWDIDEWRKHDVNI